ncbi:HAMP domain-containing histidine kinase [Myxococcota bacterium]|nr:HAMP domain-containing histidine kinase [Myxococcota bacterium]
MQEPLLARLSQFYRRTQAVLVLAILFPTVFTTAVGIVSLALYSEVKDIIFGVLTITFAIGITLGFIIVVLLTKKSQELALKQTLFLANVSHELRSPLTAIKMYAQTLERGRTPDNTDLCVQQILSATDRLDRLIQQILEWKRITNKSESIQPRPCNANLPAQDTVDHFLSTHPNADEYLTLDLMNEPPEFDLDRDSLERALYNLLDNAFKYTGEDRAIGLTTRLVTEATKVDRFFEYRVSDNGQGIPSEHLAHIFDVFYRAEGTFTGVSGVGLGLGIARSIVVSHGGSIFVESEVDRGSCFIIRIPLTHTKKSNGNGKGTKKST